MQITASEFIWMHCCYLRPNAKLFGMSGKQESAKIKCKASSAELEILVEETSQHIWNVQWFQLKEGYEGYAYTAVSK